MLEQSPNLGNLDNIEMAKITPKEATIKKPVELTPEEDTSLIGLLTRAKAAERAGNKTEAIQLYQDYQNSYEAIRAQRAIERRGEREISPEVLENSQKVYDFIFGVGTYNLQELYDKGEILGLSREQQVAIETEPNKDKQYSLELIMPGAIPREEFLQAFKAKYAQEFSSDGIWQSDQAKEDIDKTQAVLNPDRPAFFYTVALKTQREVSDAHLETMGQTPDQAEAILNTEQTASPDLNLKGMTLPEYLLLDAHHYLATKEHLDDKGYSYLLGEKIADTGRTLDADWYSGYREVNVSSHSAADSGRGSRFVAVSHGSLES